MGRTEIEVETAPIFWKLFVGATTGTTAASLLAEEVEDAVGLVGSIEGPNRLRGPVGIEGSRLAGGRRSLDEIGPSDAYVERGGGELSLR